MIKLIKKLFRKDKQLSDIELTKLVQEYKKAAVLASSLDTSTQKQHRSAGQIHKAYKQLKQTQEGKEAIMSLMADDEPGVRSWAAAHSLAWNQNKAIEVLKSLQNNETIPWHIRFDAEMTLDQYSEGRLSFDN